MNISTIVTGILICAVVALAGVTYYMSVSEHKPKSLWITWIALIVTVVIFGGVEIYYIVRAVIRYNTMTPQKNDTSSYEAWKNEREREYANANANANAMSQ